MSAESIMADKKASDVYDRQVRLWGADAQAKMAQTRVLYIHVTGVSSEMIKNLVLAGIRASICDTRSLDQVAATPSLFFSAFQKESNDDNNDKKKKTKYSTVMEALKPVIEELNPLLGECETIPDWKAAIQEFPLIVASHLSMADALYIAQHKLPTTKFILTDTFGLYGAAVFDLGPNLEYRPEKGKELMDPVTLEPYIPMDQIFATRLSDATNRFHKQAPPEAYWRYRCFLEYRERTGKWLSSKDADVAEVLESYLQETADASLHDMIRAQFDSLNKTAEISPVCAVLGGMLGNEMIKVISGKGQPANNTVLMDGITCKGLTFLVKPKT
ncbi:ubiquitin-like 1-activating enzyme E1 A [Fistulifera solaris]|uniref:Ubiquitin-like 1-activating enzyme E1 A n=1 Tax=Fistulifera solaris TaxID=1519565 RepID=A0A1Z5JEK4_FISSO|nr:ubiquitin-like 1-activating enzyme E1 A [Fistulifera solaris]|eukprot:GAX12191.1 ubiquitin-like 1-activating enzyme E1 A [Fistulifera solaris]